MFMAWVSARASGNEQLEQFYHQRLRPEFRPIFDAWLATNPLTNPEAPATPFGLSSQLLKHGQHALDLDNQSKALFEAGYRANHYADTYVLGTVVFATVLFFCGIVQQFRDIRIRVFLLSVAILLLMFGLSKILVLPSA